MESKDGGIQVDEKRMSSIFVVIEPKPRRSAEHCQEKSTKLRSMTANNCQETASQYDKFTSATVFGEKSGCANAFNQLSVYIDDMQPLYFLISCTIPS